VDSGTLYLALMPFVASIIGTILATVRIRLIRGRPLDRPRKIFLGAFFFILLGCGYGFLWEPEIDGAVHVHRGSWILIAVWIGVVVYTSILLNRRLSTRNHPKSNLL
jgi:uncharacterized membrane protein AbrB (regulator of aidB expression)